MGDWSSLEQKIHERADEIMDQAYELVLDDCRDDCPVSTPTPTSTREPGQLRDSLRLLEQYTNGTLHVRAIGSDLDYAPYTDEVDTGTHDIFGNPWLRFWWDGPNGPGIYFYKHVVHPGTTGQRWFHSKNLGRFQSALATVTGG